MSVEPECRTDAGTQALAADYQDLAAERGWHVQECLHCSAGCFPPRLRCHQCGSAKLRWAPVGQSGTLSSVVFVRGDNPRHRPARSLRRDEGYATGIVVPDNWPNVRFPVLIEGIDATAAAVGKRVDIVSATVGRRIVPAGRVLEGGAGDRA